MTNEVPSPVRGKPARQPPGLFLLFGVEMWERFSFYGMRAFLTLFLISNAGGFGWSKEQASHLYGWYQGLVYLTPLLGGYLADRFLGTHRSIIIGGIVIASGHFCLAVPAQADLLPRASALIIVGTGFFKSNISTMVGQLYTEGDRRRDAAFTIFYMGINLGAAIGQIVCPKLADRYNWHVGFSAAGLRHGAGAGRLPPLQAPLPRHHRRRAGRPRAPRRTSPSGRQAAADLARKAGHRRHRHPGVLQHLLLDGLRAGRLVDDLLRRGAHAPHVPGHQLLGALFPVGQLHRGHPAGAGVRLDVDAAGSARPRAQHARSASRWACSSSARASSCW